MRTSLGAALAALRRRRSIRRFTSRRPGRRLVERLLEAACWAPSAMNGRPWRFVVVEGPAALARLAAVKARHQPRYKAGYPSDVLKRAPLVVAVCVERRRSAGRAIENGVFAAANLMTAAAAAGLGSVFLAGYRRGDPGLEREVRAALGLGRGVLPCALIPIGYPAEVAPARPLERLSARVRWLGAERRAHSTERKR